MNPAIKKPVQNIHRFFEFPESILFNHYQLKA